MQRILVVEDDFDIQELLQNFLQEAGYEVAVANDGVEALSLFAGERYDLIVLDIMLPKIDGYGVCELIRKQSDVPIIMLTALSGEEDQIKGLDLQVDDYITKPFSMPVLLRKIAAVLRRSNRGTDEKYQIIAYGNLLLNCDNYTATVDGVTYELTQTSVYKGYKQDKIEMRGDRAEMSDFPLYLNTVAGGLDRRDQTIGGFSFVVKIYAVPVVEIIGQLLYLLGRYGFNAQFSDCL